MKTIDRTIAAGLVVGLLCLAPAVPADDSEPWATKYEVIQGMGGKLTQPDRSFIQSEADYHGEEAQAVREALGGLHDQAVRDYAERLISDHELAYDKLSEVAAMHGVHLGPMSEQGRHDNGKDQGDGGVSGDQAFLHARIGAEKQALKRLRQHQDSAAEPNLSGYVDATIPVVQEHLTMAWRLAGKAAAELAASPDSAERGEYLTRAGDCMSCHTRDGGQPFEGGRPLPTPYGGIIYTPNITPSKAGIGDFSDEDFLKAMHQGLMPNGEPYYPAFPYPSYTKVTDDDVRAIKAYLDTVKPSDYVPPEDDLTWPLSIREVVWGWRELFFEPGRYKPDPNKSETWNRGAYLVQGLGHCGGCHTPRNLAGAKIESKALSGAMREGWYAPNLSPPMDRGIGELSKADLVSLLQTGEAPVASDETSGAGGGKAVHGDTGGAKGAKEASGTGTAAAGDDSRFGKPDGDSPNAGPGPEAAVLGPMSEVVHKSLSYLTTGDLQAIATYLKDLPPQPSHAPENRAAGIDRNLYRIGRSLYQGWCAACHRSQGQGEAPYVPALADDPVLDEAKPNNVVMAILAGAPAKGSQAFSPYVRMPGFADRLDDAEVAAVASYLRARWGEGAQRGVPVSLVAELRNKLGPPTSD